MKKEYSPPETRRILKAALHFEGKSRADVDEQPTRDPRDTKGPCEVFISRSSADLWKKPREIAS
jgi:hypothetical protein